MNEILLYFGFTLVGAVTLRTLRIARCYTAVLTADESIFSQNHKTSWSINLPIGLTCWPTAICARVCYAAQLSSAARWVKSIKKQLRVYAFLKQVSPEKAAHRIYADYHRIRTESRPPFIRVAAVGDVFLELVLAVNAFLRRYPTVPLWVVTRKPEMVALLDRDAHNLVVCFSLDSSPESVDRMEQVLALRHPSVTFSFLRTRADDRVPACVSVIYNLQQAKGLPNVDASRLCPADARLIPREGACLSGDPRCQRCFSAAVLTKHDERRV